MSWELVFTTPFKRSFKNLADWLKEKTRFATRELSNAEDPKALGRLKKGKLEGCYGYDLTSDCRILYSVDDELRQITFHRVCSHQEVYR